MNPHNMAARKLPKRDARGRFVKASPKPLPDALIEQLGQNRPAYFMTLDKRWRLRIPPGWRPGKKPLGSDAPDRDERTPMEEGKKG
jgi:hypothetical protein